MRIVLGVCFLLGVVPVAVAQNPDCSKALVRATVSSNNLDVSNLALAWSLSEEAYNQAKTGVGASGYIYGQPASANYDQFRSNLNKKKEELAVADFELHSAAYATSGLDSTSLEAYRSCLLSSGGLSLVAGRFGSNSYQIWVVYNPGINSSERLNGRVSSLRNATQDSGQPVVNAIAATNFSGRVDRQFTLVPVDLLKETSIDVAVGNQSRALLLPPLVIPPPPARKTCTVIFASNDNDPRNFALPVDRSTKTHDCAKEARIRNATDARLGCQLAEGRNQLAEQRFAVTIGRGYDPLLSAAGPPFGPTPNCGWD